MKRLTFALSGLLGVLSLALAAYQLGRGHGYEDAYNRGHMDGMNAVTCVVPQQ